MLETLARFARPLAIGAALVLIAGVLLTTFHLLLLGWAVYALGYVLAMAAFVAVGAVNRDKMDGWAWAGLLVLEVGLVLGLAQVASIASTYAQPGAPAQLVLPLDAQPLGLAAELMTWVGLAFFGLAARGARALPTGIGWVFVVAAVIGVLADLRLINPLWWILAELVMPFGLLGVGVSLREPERAAGEATSSA